MAERKLPVVIVDDETLAREHVRRSIEWDRIGLELVGEAEDGREAIELIRSASPAIAIVDINIPYMDGIVVSEQIRCEQPVCQIVVLSGFDSFEFARRALRVGVLEYVLKPLQHEELTTALVRARDEYASQVEQLRYRSQLEQQSRSRRDTGVEAALVALLASHLPADEFDASSVASLPLVSRHARMAVIGIDGRENRWSGIQEQNRWHEAICGVVRTTSDDSPWPAVLGPDGLPVVIAESENAMAELISRIREETSRRFQFTVSVGVSEPIESVSRVSAAYQDALAALRESFFAGPEHTCLSPIPPRRHEVIVTNKSVILLALRMGRLDEIVELIDSAIVRVRLERLDVESVRLMTMEMAAAAEQFLRELDRDLHLIMDEPERSWVAIAQTRENLSELRSWLVHLFERVLEEARDDRKFKTFRVVDQAAEYIRRHYADSEMTLRSIADAGNVNPTYLSKVFKTQTGESVIEFLRRTRLERAKELMDRSPSTRVHEVADATGFSDPLYFSKVFRTHFGVSPRRYMRR